MRNLFSVRVALAATSILPLSAEMLYDFETDVERKAVPVVAGKTFSACVTNTFKEEYHGNKKHIS